MPAKVVFVQTGDYLCRNDLVCKAVLGDIS